MRAALHNLGCKVNAYETEAMQQLLEEAGYTIVPFEEEADVYVVNTCSVTNIADRKSRQMLHRAKAKNPEAVVVAAGCYVQAAGEELLQDGAVDIILGNNRKADLVPLLEEYFADHAKNCSVPDLTHPTEYESLSVTRTAEHTRAFIKVQDGCNQFCSYCIIPYTRGRIRSRDLAEVVCEVTRLARAGYREVVLTGIHLSSYGKDQKEKTSSLLELIRAVHAVEEVKRIRLGSLEPQVVTEEFAAGLASLPKLCPHFHLSMQSGCDATLKRMNRRYSAAEYKAGCERLRKVYDDPAITTDVIAGFAGETDEEFSETCRFVEDIGFYEMHVFKYSRRKGTRAASLPDQVPEQIKTARSHTLIEISDRMSAQYRARMQGRTTDLLLEEIMTVAGKECWVGYTPEYIRGAVLVDEAGEDAASGVILAGRLEGILEGEVLRFRPLR